MSNQLFDQNVNTMNHTQEYSDSEHAPSQSIQISSKRTRRMQYRLHSQLSHYRNEMKHYLVTTRFNNATWHENTTYRAKHPTLGCVYPTPTENSSQIRPDAIMFVLEMNNETNRIMGIGMVKNHTIIKKHRVYSNENYNRYAYVGAHRIDRADMTEEEEAVMCVFDVLCFTGARHMKRLQGIKAFPIDMLYKCSQVMDLVVYVRNMFKSRITNTNTNTNTE